LLVFVQQIREKKKAVIKTPVETFFINEIVDGLICQFPTNKYTECNG
jgi:hypothetical protein